MDSDKFLGEENLEEGNDMGSDGSSRARNRTVMLTPEITGEVRARLAKDIEANAAKGAPRSTFQPGGTPAVSPTPQSPVQQHQRAPGVSPQVTQPQVPQAAVPSTFVTDGIYWAKPSKVRGFLVAYDKNEHGEVYDLRVGRLIVTSEAAGSGSYLVIDDDTVSPMHAILKISESGDTVQVLDQLSENGTTIVSYSTGDVFELSGDKGEVMHGDIIAFGERRFQVCLIPHLEE